MRVRVLQHVPFEGLAELGPALEAGRHEIATTRLGAGDALPGAGAFEALVVLGGPMSVHDEAEHPWLGPEKALVAEAVRAGRRVLGISLGAQLLAASLGAEVRRHPGRFVQDAGAILAPDAPYDALAALLPELLAPLGLGPKA